MSEAFKFNPKVQYGDYIYIVERNASKELISEAKKVLTDGIIKFIPPAYRQGIVWVVNPEFVKVDPETGDECVVTCVAWKTTPQR